MEPLRAKLASVMAGGNAALAADREKRSVR